MEIYGSATKPFPISTVGMLIFSHSHKVLLIKSHKWKNYYTVPGGKVQEGEFCKDAAIREVKEETNLEVTNIRFAMLQEGIFSEQFWKKAHLIMHDYVGELKLNFKEEDVKLNDEAEEFYWATAEEVDKLNLTRETRHLWEWSVKNHYPLIIPPAVDAKE